jgi:hypothetical protein
MARLAKWSSQPSVVPLARNVVVLDFDLAPTLQTKRLLLSSGESSSRADWVLIRHDDSDKA